MTYVGTVSTASMDGNKPEVYVVNDIEGIKEKYAMQTSPTSKSYEQFGVSSYSWWILYAQDDNMFYSTKETTNIEDLQPLSALKWNYELTSVKYYIYKKEEVQKPSNMTYVGTVSTASVDGNKPELYIVNKLDGIKEKILSSKTYTKFKRGRNLATSFYNLRHNTYTVNLAAIF
jgi:hypothetical protein